MASTDRFNRIATNNSRYSYATAYNVNNKTLSGRAPRGAQVPVYIDNTLNGTATADESGNWSLVLSGTINPGQAVKTGNATGNGVNQRNFTIPTAPALGALSLSPYAPFARVHTPVIGEYFAARIAGGSGGVLTLGGAGSAGLSISQNYIISGYPTTAGPIDVIETLGTASNSPRTTSAIATTAASGTNPLGPTTASFISGATAGTLIANITGLSAGETLASVAPNDGRLALASNPPSVVVGLSASSAGSIAATLTTSAGRTLSMAITVNAASSVTPFAFQSETNTFGAALTTPMVTSRKRSFDRLVRRLKARGIVTKARHLSVVGADLDASLRNIKVPSEKMTAVGTPTFTADQHIAGASGLNYVNSGIQASSLSQNNFGFYAWFHQGHMDPTASQAGSTLGVIDSAGNGISLVPNNGGGVVVRCGGASVTVASASGGFGLIGASRFNANEIEVSVNGAKRATVASTSAALPALPIFLNGLNNNGAISNGNVVPMAFFYVGEALTETETRHLTAAVGEYLESIRYGEYYNEEPGVGTASISKDFVAYGLTGQSVNAAVAAARLGKSVAIVGGWRDRFAFGMAGGGLGYTDFDSPTGLGGLPRWMISDMNTQEGQSDTASGTNPDAFKFTSKRFNRVCKKLLAQYGIPVYLSNGISTANKSGLALASIATIDGRSVTAKQWHDGSYENDLIRMVPGISVFKGREAAGAGFEAVGGIRDISTAAQPLDASGAVVVVDPWKTPGQPSSGLLPGIQKVLSTFTAGISNYGTVGAADAGTPAYNFRLTFTNAASLRVPLPSTPPSDFNAENYEVYLRWFAATTAANQPVTLADIFKQDNLRGTSRYDLNKQGILSTNLSGQNHGYPTGSYAEREVIWKKQWNHIMGLWYLLQYHNDSRVPSALRTAALAWGMCGDHYYSPHENDEPFFNPQLYVREGVRLVGAAVMSGGDMARSDGNVPFPNDKIVSVASYAMDSHSVWAVAHETSAGVWQLRHEGGMFQGAGGANLMSPLSFDIFVPRAAECSNVSCSFGGSLTHVAYGSSRMEFTAMQTGYSMAVAACLAIDGDNVIQNVNYANLRTALLNSPVLSGEVAPVIPQTT